VEYEVTLVTQVMRVGMAVQVVEEAVAMVEMVEIMGIIGAHGVLVVMHNSLVPEAVVELEQVLMVLVFLVVLDKMELGDMMGAEQLLVLQARLEIQELMGILVPMA
jgi:hypothetical protein